MAGCSALCCREANMFYVPALAHAAAGWARLHLHPMFKLI